MHLRILVVLLTLWKLVIGECWKANIQNGVRCKDVFERSRISSELGCLLNCLQTTKCCSVNYVKEHGNCEFCTAGPTIAMTTDTNTAYIGYTVLQENCAELKNMTQNMCHACAELFDDVQVTVNKTDDGDVKIYKCNGNAESETKATCKMTDNQWSTRDVTCNASTPVTATPTICFDKNSKETFNKPVSTLASGGTCLRWDDGMTDPMVFPDSYFVADGKSKAAAKNYCRYPTLAGIDKKIYQAAYLYCSHDHPYTEKGMCAVLSCDSTDLDRCGAPPSLPAPAVRSYPVVGDVYLANYQCPSFSGNSPTPHCPVSRCLGNNNWTIPSISCSNKDCYTSGESSSYMGKRTCTESGRTCQAWAASSPHTHNYLLEHGPIDGNNAAHKNYCREFSNGQKPWCFTTDPDTRWENCGVPDC